MEFVVLGPVQARGDGSGAVAGRGHRRTLLALLLAAGGETVTTDALIDGLWPQEPPATARKTLQSHVSRLRRDLDELDRGTPEAIVSTAGGYRVDLDLHDLDAQRFEQLVDAARHELGGDPEQALAVLDEALAVWRGPAFGELAAHPGLRHEAVRLERLRRSARGDRTEALLALGHHRRAAAAARQLLDGDPLDERAHAQLLLALYRDGQQSEALASYRALRDRLRDELGVDPSPELQALHQQVLQHDPDLAAAPSAQAPSHDGPPDRRPGGGGLGADAVPVARDLVGRDEDVAAVAELVAPGRLVTLTGPGGVGKTRVAEQVVARTRDRFADGAVFVGLAAVRAAEATGDAIITALGIQPTGERSVPDVLVSALGERRLLLVLDNCEHVLGAVTPLVTAILARCPNVALLTTSRQRLGLPGEQLWQVAPLGVPDPGASRDELLATPAGRLFHLRAQQADPSFQLDEGTVGDVTELCRRLDGMPLAIELAAARTRAMAPADLVARLDQRFTLLAGGPRHESGRHRTLQAVVAWSHDLLGPDEAALFERISVFSGRVDLATVEDVCAGEGIAPGDVAGVLGELVDKSMVVADRTERGVRYRLLDTLREFGAQRLAATDDPDTWRRRHADHHVRLVEQLGPQVRGPDEPTAVAGINGAFDDIRGAHAWLVDIADVEGALRIPAALGDYFFYRLRDEVTTWARRAVGLPGAQAQPQYAAALATAAYGATSRTECDRAESEAAAAVEHAGPDARARLWALAAFGTVALYEGRLDELLVRADEVDGAADGLDDDFYRGFAGVLRVLAHSYRGDDEAALAALPDLHDAAAACGSPSMRAFALYCRGEALLDDEPDEALAALEEAVELAGEVDNALVAGVSLVSLASLHGRLGHTTAALRTYHDVITHWRGLGDHTHQLTTLRNLVALLAEVEPGERVAVLHGAATAGDTPSFGPEQERLDQAWSELEAALGSDAAAGAAARGRDLSPTRAGAVALACIDRVLAG